MQAVAVCTGTYINMPGDGFFVVTRAPGSLQTLNIRKHTEHSSNINSQVRPPGGGRG